MKSSELSLTLVLLPSLVTEEQLLLEQRRATDKETGASAVNCLDFLPAGCVNVARLSGSNPMEVPSSSDTNSTSRLLSKKGFLELSKIVVKKSKSFHYCCGTDSESVSSSIRREREWRDRTYQRDIKRSFSLTRHFSPPGFSPFMGKKAATADRNKLFEVW